MLAIQARSFNNYFYLQNNNTNHPARFIQNKVTGILFENKVDYTSTSACTIFLPTLNRNIPFLHAPFTSIIISSTLHHLTTSLHLKDNIINSSTAYFGSTPSLIHGIHMLPISPPSYYLRQRQFIKEEWEKFFDNGRANVEGPSTHYITTSLPHFNPVCRANARHRWLARHLVCQSRLDRSESKLHVLQRWSQWVLG